MGYVVIAGRDQCPLLRVKRTWTIALHMSGSDPKRTLGRSLNEPRLNRYDALVDLGGRK